VNRRSFFKRAAMGAAALAVAPTLLSEPFMPQPIVATIGEYAEHTSFSSFAVATSIDEVVQNAAVELGTRYGQSLNELYKQTYDV